jgi:hypothetical protein
VFKLGGKLDGLKYVGTLGLLVILWLSSLPSPLYTFSFPSATISSACGDDVYSM